MDKELLQSTVSKVLDEMRLRPIPLGVSNRHIHLSAQDYERLFPAIPSARKKRCCSRDNTPRSKPSPWWDRKGSSKMCACSVRCAR